MQNTIQADLAIPSILGLLEFNHQLFIEKIRSLTDQQAMDRPSTNANPILWIAGHLTNSRVHISELLGGKLEYPWMPLFKDAFDPEAKYPGLGELDQAWQEASKHIHERLKTCTEADLSEEISYQLPHGQKDLRGALVFWLYHEAWHLGQISYLRKCQGMEGFMI